MLDVGQHARLEFADAAQLAARCLGEIRFPEHIAPSVAARRHRILANPGGYSGPWGDGPYFVRHLDRIMDCLATDSGFREVGVMGPSQVGKSEIGNNWQLHKVLYDPTDMLFVMPDRTSIDSYVKTQFDKMIEVARGGPDDPTPVLQQRMIAGASADTINLKRFRGGDLHFLWPTGPTFRARPIPCGRLDDLDDIPTDIADQGDAVSLMRGRMGSFAAFGRTMLYVNSTPKLGPAAGIEAFVAAGTDERLWVDCLMCAAPFEFSFDRLSYEKQGTPMDAAASAAIVCEECGGAHLARDKRRLLETFRWVGKGETAIRRTSKRDKGKEGTLEPNVRAAFRLDGVAGFRPWSEIAQQAREAEIAFELEQDEAKLKAFDQTIVGRNYRKRRSGETAVELSELEKRAKASTYVLGEVPPGVLVLIASIDQQANRFETSVWGFGQNFRAWLVDRFPLVAIEEDGRPRPIRPFSQPEDWAVIHAQVMARTYPLAGAPHLRMKLFNTVVDTGGLDGATDNAFAWWHAMVTGDPGSGRPPLPATAITLVKGGNRPGAKLLAPPTIDAKRQIKGAPQAELYVPNVNRMKDIADTRLNRREDGPGFIHFPRDVDPRHLAELRAETKDGEQWVREPHSANETWDLYIYAYTAIVRFGGSDASLSWVPAWARPPKGGPAKLAESLPQPADATEGESAPEKAPMKRIERNLQGARRPKPRRTIRTVRAR